MIKSFEVIPQNSSTINPTVSTYQNTDYGIQIQYPSDWSKQESVYKEIGTIIGDKAYSVQYIADAPRYADYLPTVQEMISSLVIKNSTETDIGTIPDNSTNLYSYNLEKCHNGLCYVMWTKNR